MSRRTLTLLLASVLALGMTLTAGLARVPYVALAPGPTYNTIGLYEGKPVITVEGRKTYDEPGNLNMTTISVVTRLTLVEALRGWFQRDLAVVPREVIYPPDRTDDEVREEEQAAFRGSQESATAAALKQLGVPGKLQVLVEKVSGEAPASGKLKPDDQLVAIDGTAVTGGRQLRELIGRRTPGQPVKVAYVRAGKRAEVTLVTAATRNDDGTTRPVIGVETREQTDFPVKVKISLGEIGGPSAGLMFALGIIEKLGPESLTGGRFIAGTGTIDVDGAVGPIGGISQKLIAAREKKATVFLVPAANCAEAVQSLPVGLTLVKVETLKGALGELQRLRSGAATTPCAK